MAKGPTKSMHKRMLSVCVFLCGICFTALIVRLFYLQIFAHEYYQTKAISQQTRDINIAPSRGTIYDRNGIMLARSALAYMVYVAPSSIKDDQTKELITSGLSEILGVEKEKLDTMTQKKSFYEIVVRRIETDLANQVRAFITDNKLSSCVYVVDDPKRYYPFNNFASHVIGFTGTDNQGLAGIEEYYDKYLRGVPGRIITAKNAVGTDMPFDYEMYIEPQNGYSLTLTIDQVVQHYLEKHLEDAFIETKTGNRAAGIVMDVKTGEILAMSVMPDYDLNSPFELVAQKDIDALAAAPDKDRSKVRSELLNAQWRNKTLTEAYDPGSAYKVITTAAALEENVVKQSDSFFCNGFRLVSDRTIHCTIRRGHGPETFLNGLENSCNPVFMDVGAKLGAANTFKYATAFGIRDKTGIDLPGEGQGLFHAETKIGPVQLATISFGQTFTLTPISLITAIASIGNGGKLMQPKIVREIKDANDNVVSNFSPTMVRQVISQSTADEVLSMMQSVVDNGTGRNAKIAGYKIAGKTATSEKTGERNEAGEANKRIASFVALAPADDPKFAVLIILDEPHTFSNSGGTLAAPVAKALLAEILPLYGYEPQLSQQEIDKNEKTVPNLVGKTGSNAVSELIKLDLKYDVKGDPGTIRYQIPSNGQRIPSGGTVILYTDSGGTPEKIKVPNVMGDSPALANSKLAGAKLNIKIDSSLDTSGMTVYTQSPAAGEEVFPGTVVTLQFKLVSDVAD